MYKQKHYIFRIGLLERFCRLFLCDFYYWKAYWRKPIKKIFFDLPSIVDRDKWLSLQNEAAVIWRNQFSIIAKKYIEKNTKKNNANLYNTILMQQVAIEFQNYYVFLHAVIIDQIKNMNHDYCIYPPWLLVQVIGKQSLLELHEKQRFSRLNYYSSIIDEVFRNFHTFMNETIQMASSLFLVKKK